jgi:hydroxypyruvate reductase
MTTRRSILREIYAGALARCAPASLVERHVRGSSFSWILAFGKCAVPMARGALDAGVPGRGIVVAPEGYGDGTALPSGLRLVRGTHPDVTEASVAAARAALAAAAEEKGPCLVLASGGGSACLEAPLEPWFDLAMVVAINRTLVRSGLDIEAINTVRKHLSAVKGGRLGVRLDAGSRTLVYSDVPRGRAEMVGSGPTLGDPTTNDDAATILESLGTAESVAAARVLRSGAVPETPGRLGVPFEVVAENATLVASAAQIARELGLRVRLMDGEIAGDVADVARRFAREAGTLGDGEILVAGGEPTVRVSGSGRGGRCSELAARFALENRGRNVALFGSSDGVDGSSPAAAVLVTRALELPPAEIELVLADSDSATLSEALGEPIIMEPTGNNLRDLYLVAGR